VSRGETDDVAALAALAGRAAGIDFAQYRRPTIERRLAMRVAQLGAGDLASYRAKVASDPAEARHLAEILLVRTTEAFRDRPVFDALRSTILPALALRRASARARRLRVWSAGVSTGEEAFSLAALALLAAEPHRLEVDVLASDVSGTALERAARGVVPRGRMSACPSDLVSRFFETTDEGYAVAPELLERITFSRHDLLDPSRIAPREAVVATFDVVSCRNVMIYLEPGAARALLERLVKASSPGGVLLLGTAEALPRELHELARPVGPSVYERTGVGAD
jgi:chemotaxis protein methyltransferase CheR